MSTLQADQLADAIHESAVTKVSLLLSEHKPTAQQLVKYLDTAEQVIRMRRDNPGLCYISKEMAKNRDRFQWLSVASLTYCLATPLCACYLDYFSDAGLKMIAISMPISMAITIACLSARDNASHEIKTTLYSNAIKIKEMLYDCSSIGN